MVRVVSGLRLLMPVVSQYCDRAALQRPYQRLGTLTQVSLQVQTRHKHSCTAAPSLYPATRHAGQLSRVTNGALTVVLYTCKPSLLMWYVYCDPMNALARAVTSSRLAQRKQCCRCCCSRGVQAARDVPDWVPCAAAPACRAQASAH
jgi:hypothetical protein